MKSLVLRTGTVMVVGSVLGVTFPSLQLELGCAAEPLRAAVMLSRDLVPWFVLQAVEHLEAWPCRCHQHIQDLHVVIPGGSKLWFHVAGLSAARVAAM